MKCIECKGTGNIPNSPYREAPPMEQEEKPVKLSFYKRVLKRYLKIFLHAAFVAVCIGLAGYLAYGGFSYADRFDKEERAKIKKQGYVVVQYDDKGKVARCWITPADNEGVVLNDHTAKLKCDDRFNAACINWASHQLGIEDPGSCIQ